MMADTDQGIAEATRWLIEQQTLVRAPKREPLPTPIISGGGMPTITVAASDSTVASKRKADLECSGVDDQVTFRRAILLSQSAGWEGRVNLCEGDYYCTVDISPTLVVSGMLQGTGKLSTYISVTGGNVGDDFIRLDGGELRDVLIEADNLDARIVQPLSGSTIDSCTLLSGPYAAVYANFGFALGRISNSRIYGGEAGIWIAAGTNMRITDCDVEGNDYGLYDAGGVAESFITNSLFAGDSAGVYLTGANTLFSNCRIVGASGPAIDLDTAHENQITGCDLIGFTVRMFQADKTTLTGNRITCTDHGVTIDDTDDAVLTGNWVTAGVHTDNTYDGIHLVANSDRNSIQSNRIWAPAAGNRPRYGINVAAASNNNNVVNANVIGPTASFITGIYNDAGTGTQGTQFTV